MRLYALPGCGLTAATAGVGGLAVGSTGVVGLAAASAGTIVGVGGACTSRHIVLGGLAAVSAGVDPGTPVAASAWVVRTVLLYAWGRGRRTRDGAAPARGFAGTFTAGSVSVAGSVGEARRRADGRPGPWLGLRPPPRSSVGTPNGVWAKGCAPTPHGHQYVYRIPHCSPRGAPDVLERARRVG